MSKGQKQVIVAITVKITRNNGTDAIYIRAGEV
jgi:hypothetical protein